MRFDNERFAVLYDRQQDEAGYPGKLLPFVLEQLRDYNSVIDIGSGSGFFTIPLVKNGHTVTAIEPSAEMSNIMMNKAKGINRSGLTLYNMRWEDWSGPAHDASICVHSLYPLADRKLSVEKMLRLSARRIIIIRNTKEMKTITGLVRTKLKPHESPDLNDELSSMLNNLDVNFCITEIREERKTVIREIDDEVESIMFRADIPSSCRAGVKEILLENCTSSGNSLLYNSIFCDNAYLF